MHASVFAMVAGAMLFGGAGAAGAACSNKNLAGEWLVDIRVACETGACSALCQGKMGPDGRFQSASCSSESGRKTSFAMAVKMKSNCIFAGETVLTQDSLVGPEPVQSKNLIRATLGSFGGQFIGVSRWLSSQRGYLPGRIDGMRVGN